MAGVGRWSGSRPVDTRGRQQLPWEPCGVVRPLPVAPRVPPKCHASSAREGFHTGRGASAAVSSQVGPWFWAGAASLQREAERLQAVRVCPSGPEERWGVGWRLWAPVLAGTPRPAE